MLPNECHGDEDLLEELTEAEELECKQKEFDKRCNDKSWILEALSEMEINTIALGEAINNADELEVGKMVTQGMLDYLWPKDYG